VKGAGLEGKFQKLGLRRGFDFILHLPLRYEDETVLGTAENAVPGEPLQIEARVERAAIAYRPRRQLIVHAQGLVLRFYNFYGSQLKQFQRAAEQGLRVRAFGELRGGWFGAEMVHPRYRIVNEGEPLPEALTPVYPSTAQLPQRELRMRVLQALDSEPLGDTLSDEMRARYGLAGFAESVTLLHRPPPGSDLGALAGRSHSAWRRMKFDELLAQQLSMRFAYRARRARRAPKLPGDGPLLKAFFERLPFKLTRSQSLAAGEVLRDLKMPQPMQRLLQGDVGSGKTVVAAIACLAAVDAGWQAAVMAPTEILSEQHWHKFHEWLAPLGVRIGWLHGGLRKKEKRAAAEAASPRWSQSWKPPAARAEAGAPAEAARAAPRSSGEPEVAQAASSARSATEAAGRRRGLTARLRTSRPRPGPPARCGPWPGRCGRGSRGRPGNRPPAPGSG